MTPVECFPGISLRGVKRTSGVKWTGGAKRAGGAKQKFPSILGSDCGWNWAGNLDLSMTQFRATKNYQKITPRDPHYPADPFYPALPYISWLLNCIIFDDPRSFSIHALITSLSDYQLFSLHPALDSMNYVIDKLSLQYRRRSDYRLKSVDSRNSIEHVTKSMSLRLFWCVYIYIYPYTFLPLKIEFNKRKRKTPAAPV